MNCLRMEKLIEHWFHPCFSFHCAIYCKSINEQRTSIPVSLKIHLKVEENTIIFTCLCLQVNLLEDKGLERIRQRLNLLYGNRYRLFLTTESIWLELKGGEV